MAKAIDTANALDQDMSKLATLLVTHLSESLNTADLATQFNVRPISVYKWLTGHAISAPYAFVIVTKAGDHAKKIKHKRTRDQAERLLVKVSDYLNAKVTT